MPIAPTGKRISAVISTLGERSLRRVLHSLAIQTMPVHEVIVVHQGVGDHIATELAEFNQSLNITYVQTSTRGASRGRNEGILRSCGEYIFFPDDDCWYPENFCQTAVNYLADSYDVVGGKSCPDENHDQSKVGSFGNKPFLIDKSNVLRSTIEFVIFVKSEVAKALLFDPHLGVGSGTLLGSDEGVDFILRAIKLGYVAIYTPRLVAFHPDPLVERSPSLPMRGRKYATGRGYILLRYKFPMRVVLREIIGPMARIIQMAFKGDLLILNYYIQVLYGKINGMAMGHRNPEECI